MSRRDAAAAGSVGVLSPSASVMGGIDDAAAGYYASGGAVSSSTTPSASHLGGTSAAPSLRVAWKKDEAVHECERCSKPFKLYRRRHHCRRCGGIFCGECASEKAAGIAGWAGPERVCMICSSMSTTLRAPVQARERRIVVLGAQGVGKTAIHNIFVPSSGGAGAVASAAASPGSPWDVVRTPAAGPGTVSTSAVTGAPLACRRYRHKSGIDYNIMLVDTIGQQQFGLFQAALAVGTHAFLLVFSAEERSSLTALRGIREKIFDCGAVFQPCTVLCTTRGPSGANRSIVTEEGEAAARDMYATRYMEADLTKDAEVNLVFDRMLDDLVGKETA